MHKFNVSNGLFEGDCLKVSVTSFVATLQC